MAKKKVKPNKVEPPLSFEWSFDEGFGLSLAYG